MKLTITFKKTSALLLLCVFTLITSCSSDSKDDPKSTTVVGKWTNYKRVVQGVTYNSDYNLIYEFETNAALISENGYITNYSYKIDGDFIKFYDPKTEALKKTDKFSLSKDDLIIYRTGNNNSVDELHFKKI